jgi:large subunit ribosomal protein L29
MNKSAQLRELDDQALVQRIRTIRKDIFGVRFQHATGELENTAGMNTGKRDLARALTIARQRGIDVEGK